jgi:Ca2+-binding EF-hand superfamily protein
MCRSWQLCFVLGVSVLANVWIGALARVGGDASDDAVMADIKDSLMEEAAQHDPDDIVDDEDENEGNEEWKKTLKEAYVDEEGGDHPSDFEDEDSVWTNEHLTKEQFQKLHKKADASGDGKITISELLDFSDLTRTAIVQKDAGEGFPGMDGDDDGKISLNELLENTVGPIDAGKEDADEKAMRELDTAKFKAADKNGDGFLDKDESVGFLYPELNDGVLSLVATDSLKTKDKNNDGELEHLEFWAAADGEEEDDIDKETPNQDILDNQKEEFGKLDLNKNGKLDATELKHWESGRFHTVDALTHLFGIADEDEDGFVTASELDKSRLHLSNHIGIPHLQEWAAHYEL